MVDPVYPGLPYDYNTQQGLIVPDTSTVQSDIQALFQTLFGATLSLDANTPQGLLITALTIARSAQLRANADLANQINPNLAGGGFLDAIGELTGLQRTPASPSTVSGVTLSGAPNAIIPSGSMAKTAAGDLFNLITTVQLDTGGNGIGNFQSVASGPIPCAANALNTIVTAVIGWETVTNPNEAVLGSNTQSDAAFRALRKATLAKQGKATPAAMFANVTLVPGVISLQFLENVENTTQVIKGISLVAHSVWACVQCGLDQDVANALLESKSSGSNWNGATTVSAVDPASGQTYAVKFDRPTLVNLWIRATVVQISPVLNVTSAVTQAILNWANNLVTGIPGALVGQSVSPFEVSAAIAEQVSGIYVRELAISNDGSTWQTTEYSLNINQVAAITSGRISVVIQT